MGVAPDDGVLARIVIGAATKDFAADQVLVNLWTVTPDGGLADEAQKALQLFRPIEDRASDQ